MSARVARMTTAVLFVVAQLSSVSHAQESYPVKTIRLIVRVAIPLTRALPFQFGKSEP